MENKLETQQVPGVRFPRTGSRSLRLQGVRVRVQALFRHTFVMTKKESDEITFGLTMLDAPFGLPGRESAPPPWWPPSIRCWSTTGNASARVHARVHACTHACTRARVHACTRARVHACVHACTRACTRALAFPVVLQHRILGGHHGGGADSRPGRPKGASNIVKPKVISSLSFFVMTKVCLNNA